MATTTQGLALAMLLDAAAVRARHEAVENRIAEEAREQQRRAAEAQREADLVARAQREQREKVRRVLGASGVLLGGSFAVWLVTPVIGSILSIFSDTIDSMVFLDGDTGDTAGSGPFALYKLLAGLLVGMVVSLTASGLLLPYPRDEEVISSASIGGAVLGILILLIEVFTGSGSESSWWWAPILAVVFHVAYGLARKLNESQPVDPTHR